MPSTKIINVLRTDSFKDILAIFKGTEARDVVFVLPRKAKALTRDDHFAELAVEAKALGKTVSILATSPDVNAMAQAYQFVLLSTKQSTPAKPAKKRVVRTAPQATVIEEAPQPVAPSPGPAEAEVRLARAGFGGPDFHDEVEDDMNTSDYRTPGGDSDDEEEDEIPEGFHEEGEDEEKKESEDFEEVRLDDDSDEEEDDHVDLGDDLDDEESGRPALNDDADEIAADASPITATLAVKKNRVVEDIIPPRRAPRIVVEQKSEKPLTVHVQKNDTSPAMGNVDQTALDKIREVWQTKSSIWDDAPKQSSAPSRSQPLPQSQSAIFGKKKVSIPASSGRGFGAMQSNRGSRKIAMVLSACALIVCIAVVYVSAGSATIIIKPKSSEVNFGLKVKASDTYTAVESATNQVPGQLFRVEKQVEDTFSATGERDVAQKARGTVTIYNEYGTTPQTLIATTRLEAEDGLIFRLLTTVTVPGTTVTNGQVSPGKISVEIVADKAGEVYNIPAGKFTIPAFKEKGDAARYQKFYATSETATKGGIVGKAKVVTESDMNSAQEAIRAKAIAAAASDLEQQASGLTIVSAPTPTIKNLKASATVDEATDSFTVSASATVESMGFQASAIQKLIDAYLKQTGNFITFPDKITVGYENIRMNAESSVLEFTSTVKGTAYAHVDTEALLKDLYGKKEVEITDYLKGKETVGSARVLLKPFWIKRIPTDPQRTSLKLEY